MKIRQLESFLRFLDAGGQWLFTIKQIRAYFPSEETNTLRHALVRHAQAGRIVRVCRGVYAFPFAMSRPLYELESIIPFLRPWELTYISLESRLHELGLISQIPTRLTCMTSGRSALFQTPFGSIEFSHTKRQPKFLLENLDFDVERGVYLASQKLALADLQRTGRNLDLVDYAAPDQ